MDEGKLWQKIKPGGKTKEEFEKGELTQDGRPGSAEELYETLKQVRKIKTAELKAKEKVKEVPKNLEEIEFIGMVQMMISEERTRLGLLPGFHIELEQTRLFHREDWKLREGYNSNQRGEYKALEGLAETQTRTPDSVVSPYAYFKTISHELLHQASDFESDPLGGHSKYRIGYLTYKNGFGVGLNEGMTEEINLEMLAKSSDALSARFPEEINGKPYKWWSEFPTYTLFRKIVRVVAKRVDEILYPNVAGVTWDNLKRGYFSDDQKALEDIQKALGKETLEMLLLLGNPNLFNIEPNSIQKSHWYIESRIEEYLTKELSPAQKRGIYREVMSHRKKQETPVEGDITSK